MSIRIKCLWRMSVCLVLAACGGDGGNDRKKTSDDGDSEEESECVESCTGVVEVFTGENGKVNVTFKSAEAGAEYIVMPYVLGNPKTVAGAGAEKVSFRIKASDGSGSELLLRSKHLPRPGKKGNFNFNTMDPWAYDHAQRALYERLDTTKSLLQTPEFWRAIKRLDQVVELKRSPTVSGLIADSIPVAANFKQKFEKILKQKKKIKKIASAPAFTNASMSTSCPEVGDPVLVPEPEISGDPENATIIARESGADYCIVYVSNPVTESSKTAIKASVEAILKRYKEVIYDDDFAPVNDFTFNPLFVIADFADDDVWPPKSEDLLQVAGVVLANINAEAARPVIYMASDFSKLGSLAEDADKAKKLWHGTLAHETQHAITDYFKKYVGAPADEETVAIDEGIAHFMEDVFGYGEENFPAYAGLFLSTWNEGTSAVLNASEEVVTLPSERGASEALIYYLASQKGGVKFTDGLASGGGGLEFVRKVVKSKKKGAENLAASFGGSWLTTIGNYMGALVVDGTALKAIAKINRAQDPVSKIKDLSGADEKTFGMSYNDYLDVDDRTLITTKSAYEAPDDPNKLEDLQYYQTKPLLYKVEDPKVSYEFETVGGALTNTAVAVARIK